MSIPGAAISLIVYGTFGWLALRGHAWARWVSFTLAIMQGFTCLLFAFVDMGPGAARFRFEPTLSLVALYFLLIAVGAAWPTSRHKDRLNQNQSP